MSYRKLKKFIAEVFSNSDNILAFYIHSVQVKNQNKSGFNNTVLVEGLCTQNEDEGTRLNITP